MLGCGKTRDVRDGTPSVMDEDGGASSDDGGATSGTGGGTGGDQHASGGSHSDGGAGQVGHVGGAPTWDPQQCHASPVPEPSDPAAAEQWSIVRKYCVALGKQDCLKNGGVSGVGQCTVDEAVEACVAQVLWFHDYRATPECEAVWRKAIECGTNSSFDPPICDGVGALGPYGPSNTCAEENATFGDCMQNHDPYLTVAGSYASCSYRPDTASASECAVDCQLAQYTAELDCFGSEGLPKQCGCKINGHVLSPPRPIFVNDCADAARQAADGLCTGMLDCCFEYLDHNKQTCRCDEPTVYGYADCEAMMAVAQGRRVEICPALLPDDINGGCWPPGGCGP